MDAVEARVVPDRIQPLRLESLFHRRHGRAGCSYIARHNVELGVSLSHAFDLHDGRDRNDGTDIAGTTIEIYNDTFRMPQPPIVIRSAPEEKCAIHHTWFVNAENATRDVYPSAKTKTETTATARN